MRLASGPLLQREFNREIILPVLYRKIDEKFTRLDSFIYKNVNNHNVYYVDSGIDRYRREVEEWMRYDCSLFDGR